MDRLDQTNKKKDTSLALMAEARRRFSQVAYACADTVSLYRGDIIADVDWVIPSVDVNIEHKILSSEPMQNLADFDVVLLRKDPPFDLKYLYLTQLLEMLTFKNVKVINDPAAVRSANEKLFALHFPQWCPETVVTSSVKEISRFRQFAGNIILKPLDAMGGYGVLKVLQADQNLNVMVELLSNGGIVPIMAQKFIPEVTQGDKRILMIHGKAYPHGLLRVPAEGEFRGNLAAGGRGVGSELTRREQEMCEDIGPTLLKKGLCFVGLDVIGGFLTEINVTSPTCARELDTLYATSIPRLFWDGIATDKIPIAIDPCF